MNNTDIYRSISTKHETLSGLSDVTELSGITAISDSHIRDQRLVAIALRKSANTLMMKKMNLKMLVNGDKNYIQL